jgi:hypothetical protein
VAQASEADVAKVTASLVSHFVMRHGAPSDDAAETVARREVAFASSLCDHPVGTILAISRHFDGDALVEQFKTITPDSGTDHPFGLIDLTALARADG